MELNGEEDCQGLLTSSSLVRDVSRFGKKIPRSFVLL